MLVAVDEGCIIQTGSPDSIYNCPQSIFTADFIGAGNFILLSLVRKDNHIFILETESGRKIFLREDFKKNCNHISKKIKTAAYKREKTPPVFFIRPEKIRITRKFQENKNCFEGRVKSTTFEGPDIRLEVDSEELGKIKIEIKNDGSLPTFSKNENLLFYWDYTDGMLLEY